MYLHPADLRLGHNSILKQLIEVFLIFLINLCRSTLRSCDAPLFYLRASFKTLEATTTPRRPQPPCHGTLGPRRRAVNEVTSALDAMTQERERKRKSGQNVHGLGALGEEEQSLIQT